MKTILALLTLTCILTTFTLAQPAIEWQKSPGGAGTEKANSIQQTRDGGYIVAGISDSTNGDVTGHQ